MYFDSQSRLTTATHLVSHKNIWPVSVPSYDATQGRLYQTQCLLQSCIQHELRAAKIPQWTPLSMIQVKYMIHYTTKCIVRQTYLEIGIPVETNNEITVCVMLICYQCMRVILSFRVCYCHGSKFWNGTRRIVSISWLLLSQLRHKSSFCWAKIEDVIM